LPVGAYLAGGSAVALHLGHRRSVDLDFFGPNDPDGATILADLRAAGFALEAEMATEGTVLGEAGGVKFSVFRYAYPLLAPCVPSPWGAAIASLDDLAAMKVVAIGDRGVRRDFVDLYFLCRAGLGISRALDLVQRKFATSASYRVHLVRALGYFADAEPQPMPDMLVPCRWSDVREFFEEEVRRIAREELSKPPPE
jgi:hypothetical protein